MSAGRPTGAKASLQIKLFDGGALGDQLQAQEGTVTVTGVDTKTVIYGDGTSVALHRPKVVVTANGGSVTRFSARIARPLVGLGLLEALDERALLALSDRLDCDQDLISGGKDGGGGLYDLFWLPTSELIAYYKARASIG